MNCPNCSVFLMNHVTYCQCGWVNKSQPKRDNTPIDRFPVQGGGEDRKLGKRCLRLINQMLSGEIDNIKYLEGIEHLDKDYPGIGFRETIDYLVKKWNAESVPR